MDLQRPAFAASPSDVPMPVHRDVFQIALSKSVNPVVQDSIGFFGLVIVPWILVVVLSQHILRTGYQAFLDLGPGGTPYTFRGYLKLCFLGLFVLRKPYQAPRTTVRRGYLASIPIRPGQRPRVTGIAPHRQVEQRASDAIFEQLKATMTGFAVEQPDHFCCALSAFEKHSMALFSTIAYPHPSRRSEICHCHRADGSLHMTLHPADIKIILEAGWGIRHPLARGDWWWYNPPVPEGFMMIYAPRDQEELGVVKRIMKAGAWYANTQHFDAEQEFVNMKQEIE